MAEASVRAQLTTSSFSAVRPRTRLDPVRTLRTGDVPALSRFLRACFPHSRPGFAEEAMLLWKYFSSHAAGNDLSVGVERDGVLLAHAGLNPVTFIGPRGDMVRSGTIIDWAGDERTPGVGMVAYRQLLKRNEATFLIGGADVTRKIAVALGFKPAVEARVYARWLRPWRECLTRAKSWRTLLRLLHGWLHQVLDEEADAKVWSARRVKHFDDELISGLRLPTTYGYAVRSAQALNHRLRCPSRSTWGFTLFNGEELRGYAVVSLGSWEAKILDLRIESTSDADWAAAYAVVTEKVAEAGACRVLSLAAVPHVERALEANSFWVNKTEAVSFFDPSGVVEQLLPLDVQYFDTDLSYYEP